jgi:hypothetical protein
VLGLYNPKNEGRTRTKYFVERDTARHEKLDKAPFAKQWLEKLSVAKRVAARRRPLGQGTIFRTVTRNATASILTSIQDVVKAQSVP